MYSVSANFMTAAAEPARTIKTKCVFNGTDTVTGDDTDGCIISIEMTASGETGDRLSVGVAGSASVMISMRQPSTPISLENGTVEPFLGYELAGGTIEYCTLGIFYITAVNTENDYVTVDIEAHDGMSRLMETYVPQVTLPCTVEDVLQDIESQYNLTLAAMTFPAITLDTLYNGTVKETVGWMAGLMGMNARFDRDGELAFSYYDITAPVMTIDRELQYMQGVKRLAEDFTVLSILSGSSTDPLTTGSGYGITSVNPYMDQTRLDAIGQDIIGMSYSPLTADWRGNPALELGDVVSVVDKDGASLTVPVMNLRISSAMMETVTAYGMSEASFQLSQSPTQAAIHKVYSDLQQAIISASELINGARGGIFRVTDSNNDGVNDGWLISNSPDINAATRLIKASSGGIGISTDGGNTYTTAMTADGINASTITAGQMSAERISVTGYTLSDYLKIGVDGGGHIVLTLGSSNNAIILREENDRIAFYDGSDNLLAYFSNNAFEIVDLNRFRIGSLAIVTQSNGSVSFIRGD